MPPPSPRANPPGHVQHDPSPRRPRPGNPPLCLVLADRTIGAYPAPALSRSLMDPDPRIIDRPPGPWRHGSIPVIGLIGAIGAGKSRAAALLAGRGAAVIDADAV